MDFYYDVLAMCKAIAIVIEHRVAIMMLVILHSYLRLKEDNYRYLCSAKASP